MAVRRHGVGLVVLAEAVEQRVQVSADVIYDLVLATCSQHFPFLAEEQPIVSA